MNRCRETAGILFKHRCDAPAIGQCAQCQKPVCQTHARPWGQSLVCVSCLRQQVQPTGHRGSYAHLRDDPYFFWYFREDGWLGDPYGADDYALFDRGEHEFGTGVTDPWTGS